MATLVIPTNFGLLDFRLQIELDKRVYDLRFSVNRRDNHFYLDIGLNGNTEFHGIKLITNYDLLRRFRYNKDIPQGDLRCVDLDGKFRDPTEETFGNRVVIAYTS